MINQNIMDDFAKKDTLGIGYVYDFGCKIMPPGAKTGVGRDGKSGKNMTTERKLIMHLVTGCTCLQLVQLYGGRRAF